MREQATDLSQNFDDLVEQEYFNAKGHWQAMPNAWSAPEQACEQREFWEIFQQCLMAIPGPQAAIFKLCELDGMSAKQISKDLGMSTTNIWVSMHRARLKLRDCLDKLWFNKE